MALASQEKLSIRPFWQFERRKKVEKHINQVLEFTVHLSTTINASVHHDLGDIMPTQKHCVAILQCRPMRTPFVLHVSLNLGIEKH